MVWTNVDLERRIVTLPDTNNGDRRDVPLPSKAISVLSALPCSIDGPVFPITEAALKKVYERAVEKGAGTGNLTFHDLRRTAVGGLAKRLDILDLAKVTRQRRISVLYQRYYSATAEELAQKLGWMRVSGIPMS